MFTKICIKITEKCKIKYQREKKVGNTKSGRQQSATCAFHSFLVACTLYGSLYFFILFIYLFIYLFLFVVNFVIHWNETAVGLHVFPNPIPPPASLWFTLNNFFFLQDRVLI